MAATTAGALKAIIEGLGLGLAAYRDRPPEDRPMRYCVIHEAIDVTPDRSGDNSAGTVRERVQVSLWQTWRDPATRVPLEDPALADALVAGLVGKQWATPKRAYGVRVLSAPRVVDRDENTVHHPITLEVSRAV